MEYEPIDWGVLLQHVDVIGGSTRRLHGGAPPNPALELLVEFERISAEERLGRLVDEIQAISDRIDTTVTTTKEEEGVSGYSLLEGTTEVRGMQRGDSRGCDGGLCCVFSMWFDPRFECPTTGCTHQHKWYNRMAYYKTCGPPIFPIGVFSEPSIGPTRRDDTNHDTRGDQPAEGYVQDIGSRAHKPSDMHHRRQKRAKNAKTSTKTPTTRRKHHLSGLWKRVGYTGHHWRSNTKVL